MCKLTPTLSANLCKYLAAGNYIDVACKLAGLRAIKQYWKATKNGTTN